MFTGKSLRVCTIGLDVNTRSLTLKSDKRRTHLIPGGNWIGSID
jgi:hypothetical protein